MSLHALANDMASKGRHGDSMLVHMAPNEVAGLHALALAHGENLTINPETGLPEAFNLKSLLPMVLGAALAPLTAGTSLAFLGATPLASALTVGAGYTAATGSLEKGLMAGMGAYGGAGLGAGLTASAGAAPAASTSLPTVADTAATSLASPAQVQIGAPIVDGANFSQTGQGLFGSSTPSAYYGPSSGAEAMTIGNPVAPPTPTPLSAAPTPPAGADYVSGADLNAVNNYGPYPRDMSFGEKLADTTSSYGKGIQNLSTEEGRKAFMGNAASQGVKATGVGGVGGLLKYGMAAAAPVMQPEEQEVEKPAEGNIVDYDYDPISGKYRRLRSTPASKYQSTMYAKNGGITSLLSFASGGAVDGNNPAALRASIQAGPQTQEALDAALLTYTPAQLAAAFPEYGNVADYNNATREAYARVEQQRQAANREAARADMAAKGEDVRIANPGGSVTTQSTPPPTMSPIPQSEIDAAKKNLTPEQLKFIDWQMQQPNPYGSGTLADLYAAQGVNPYANPAQAQAQIDRAGRREELFDQAGVPPGDLRPWNTPTPPGGKGGGGSKTPGPTTPGPFVTGPVAGPGPTTPTPTPTTPTGGVSNLPVTNTVIPAYQGSNSPTGGISGLQVLTPQGVMGGSERGGTVSNVSQIIPAYQQYWQNAPVGSTIDFAGGKLSRVSGAQAVFTDRAGKTYSMGPTSDLNIIAAQNPAIGETWRTEFGMVPQNYMQGESARAYEFLRGNEPYSVNQQVKGIARPYGEMALGLPGATFGSNAVINQREINEATAKQKADPTNTNLTIPAPQYGYGVTNPGTYNMQTVYDPSTGRYIANNMYTTPADVVADAKAAAAIDPTNAAAAAAPVVEVKNGGVMRMAQGGIGALAGGGAAAQYNLGGYSDGGRLLRGPGDGVSDSIPATIGNKRPARLADGEFVVPARIVSELGNGSTEAGARKLYAMMDRIQKNRSKSVGKGKVAVNSNSSKFLPA